jgi:hypothetical protein
MQPLTPSAASFAVAPLQNVGRRRRAMHDQAPPNATHDVSAELHERKLRGLGRKSRGRGAAALAACTRHEVIE